jgi:hypothetical protein
MLAVGRAVSRYTTLSANRLLFHPLASANGSGPVYRCAHGWAMSHTQHPFYHLKNLVKGWPQLDDTHLRLCSQCDYSWNGGTIVLVKPIFSWPRFYCCGQPCFWMVIMVLSLGLQQATVP